jgi:hypothetical protein
MEGKNLQMIRPMRAGACRPEPRLDGDAEAEAELLQLNQHEANHPSLALCFLRMTTECFKCYLLTHYRDSRIMSLAPVLPSSVDEYNATVLLVINEPNA